MIIFNTISKAKHYIKYKNKFYDKINEYGYAYNIVEYYIDSNNKVIKELSCDSCGCGCDTYIYCIKEVIGRIK